MADYGSGGISMSLNHQATECHSSEEDQNQDHQLHHHSPRNNRAVVFAPCLGGGGGSDTGATKSIYKHRNGDGNGGDDGDMQMIQMLTSPQSNNSDSQLLSRKPRGRPPGSKNKPKPPIIITREVSSADSTAMHPAILEISAGSDITEMVSQFSVERRVCLSILSGSGSVANVILHHSTSTHHDATISIPGCFEILSFSGCFIYPPASTKTSSTPPFSISLAGGQGQVIGGIIAGPLIAATSVFVMAASFVNPVLFRLPSCQNNEDHHDHQDEEEINVKPKINTTTGNGGNESNTTTINGGNGSIYSGSSTHPPINMSQLLNSQIPSDLLPTWAPPSSRPY